MNTHSQNRSRCETSVSSAVWLHSTCSQFSHTVHRTSYATSYIICYIVHRTVHRTSFATLYIIRYIVCRMLHHTSYATSYIVSYIVHHTVHRTSYGASYIARIIRYIVHRLLHCTSLATSYITRYIVETDTRRMRAMLCVKHISFVRVMYEQNNKVSGVINEDIGWLGTGAAVQNTYDSFKRPLALKQQIQSLSGQCRDRQTDRQLRSVKVTLKLPSSSAFYKISHLAIRYLLCEMICLTLFG